jgi:hypothetical protein
VTDLAARAHELARQYAEGGVGTGAPGAQIRVRMGLRLPEDLRAPYRLVHDDLDEYGLLCDQMLFPLEDVVAGYLGTDDDDLNRPVTSPPRRSVGRLRRARRRPGWHRLVRIRVR